MGRVEEAIESMTKAQAVNPHHPDIYYSLAVCYYKNGQHAECVEELSKAETISPPKNALQRVCVDILHNKKEEALTYLKQSIEEKSIKTYSIQRDPNLYFLLNRQELSVFI
jgi:tetratricopeptide (TPR) repeat protein